MPTYIFKCDNCNENLEIVCSMSEYNPDQTCPICGEKVKRVFSATEYVWKCSGAYGKNNKL